MSFLSVSHIGSEGQQILGGLFKYGTLTATIGAGVAAITNCALSALGASAATKIVVLAIPVTVGIVGTGAIAIGLIGIGILLGGAVYEAVRHRQW